MIAMGSLDRLYPDLAALQGSAYMNAMIEETGAVLMGKRTFEMSDGLRRLENSASGLQLEKIGVQEVGARTSLRFRVAR